MIRAVVFDMDGVLIDARDWHYECLNDALRIFGMEIDMREHLARFDGLPTKRKLAMLTADRNLPEGLHSFLNELKQMYTVRAIAQKCRPTFAHQYAMSRLREDGYMLAVASNSVRRTVEMMMEEASLIQYLEFFLSNEDVAKPKPDPDIYLQAFSRLGLPSSDCLVVEDNEHGLAAARASGAHVMRVEGVGDVTYANIRKKIETIESANA